MNADAEAWRAARRLIDLHQHIEATPERIGRAVGILDRAGVGLGVNLSGGTVTRKGTEPSEFERNLALADRVAPGRFVHYFNLDYSGWDAADFGVRAAAQVDEARRLGAAGLKEYKRLGLVLRDGKGDLIRIDDPRLDPVWKRCGELGMPVSVHVADPRAFWLPFDSSNERWKELRDHRPWWFGDAAVYPPRMDLLEALDRVIGRLHLRYEAPYSRLTTFEPAGAAERIGLWERDVVEAFIGSDPGNIRRYAEFQAAPNGMKLDLRLVLPDRDFAWDSGFEVTTSVDAVRKVWTARMSIPLESIGDTPPGPGTRWRINLFRCDYAGNAFLAWRPTMGGSFHVPERFGVLEFGD